MHELYNETIRDLLKENSQDTSHSNEGNMVLDVSAEKGLHVKVKTGPKRSKICQRVPPGSDTIWERLPRLNMAYLRIS